ncbi:MAG TPA: RNA polymerase sigma factor SigI [Acidimicrobiales bacterium]|jgi:RNA polymerase sigma-70 factor (ECF subfamily)|nr:RNA polymerase sigma factor SigI [Acidimicrobiales bacterium]
MPTDQQIKDAWIDHRPYLVDMAFRMLGDIGRAEDVVQEAFQRLSRSDFDAIEDARGWLIVVTSRLCLDVTRSARHRHEQPVGGPELAERFEGTGTGAADPADRVTLDEGVRLALLVVLERLSPAERVAFVLHDIFGVPFEAVAETVGRPEASCRQLARRGRLKIAASDGARRATVTPDEHRIVTDRFIGACASGSFQDLLAVLDPDVTGGVDLYPGLIVRGARYVAGNLLRYWEDATLVSLPFIDNPCLLGFVDRDVAGLISLTVGGERVTEIHVFCEPRALDFLREHVLP